MSLQHFFVVGNFLKENPDLVKRMQQEGHIVGNHTYTHPDMSKISTEEAFEKELGELSTLYQKTTGEEMTKFYRPPQGKYSEANLQMAKEMGYHTLFLEPRLCRLVSGSATDQGRSI